MNSSHSPTRRRQVLVRLAAVLSLAAVASRGEDPRPVTDDRSVARENAASVDLPTLWIAGDSTVRSSAPMRGWGQDLGRFFDPGKINVVNRAIGGRSSRTFFTEGKWRDIENSIKPGDFVIIQFGHNDVGPLDERGKFRGSLKGTGEETESVTKPDGSAEIVRSFGWYLRAMTKGAREKGARVILCSPVPHKKFTSEGKFAEDWVEWRGWVKHSAETEQASFLDLADLIGEAYARLEPSTLEGFFADKGTHTNAAGSMFSAKVVMAALRAMPGAPLESFLNEAGREVRPLSQ